MDERRRIVLFFSIAAFLLGLCCLPTHVARFVVVPALLAGAAASLLPDPLSRLGPLSWARDLQFLVFAFLWTLISTLGAGIHLPTTSALLSNVLLLALLALVVRGLCAMRLQREALALLFGFTTLGALLSMAAHFIGGHGAERLGSVALNGLIIPAAGGYACAILAAVVLWRTTTMGKGWLAALSLGMVVLAAALAWSESRGPIISLLLALLSIPVVERSSARLSLIAACIVAFVITASAILFESQIHAVLCASNLHRMCEPSQRLELWGWAVASIAKHPLLGVGFGNYFSDEHRPHPHNGLLALAFFAGLPMLIAFAAVSVEAALRLQIAPRSPLRLYAAPALVFGFGYMGTDLANALGFIGTHYLFLWLPIFAAYSPASEDPSPSGLPR